MKGETIFRFFNTRPAAPVNSKGVQTLTINPFNAPGKKTNLYHEFESAKLSNANALKTSCENVLKKNDSADDFLLGSVKASALIDWFNQNRYQNANNQLQSAEFIEKSGGSTKDKIPPAIESVFASIADVLAAYSFTGKNNLKAKQDLSLVIKLLYIKHRVKAVPDNETLGAFVSKFIISLPGIFSITFTFAGRKTKAAHNPVKPLLPPSIELPIEELENTFCAVSAAYHRVTYIARSAAAAPVKDRKAPPASTHTHLPKDIVNGFSAPVKNVLSKLKIDLSAVPAIEALDRIEQEIDKKIPAASMKQVLVNLDGNLINKNNFIFSLQNATVDFSDLTNVINNGNITATVGDLLMVKQRLKGYRLGEIAHIENVLSGEKRERNHRRLTRTTEDFFTEQETEKTTEKDLQSTERNELQNEMNRTVTTELGIDFGVQVSGSYGPSLSFESQLDSSFSSTVEESQRRASAFSKELTEKSSEKIRERVKTERRKTSLDEVEEVNVHGFENKGEENITGVYRWLDKIYEVQVVNYGQRLMLDFIIPEPAAFYVFSMIQNEELQLEKPEPPKYLNALLAPSNLKRCNYMRYIRAYGVTGAPEPPPQIITVSYFEKQEGKDKADFARASKIQVPDHYAAYAASVASYIVHDNNNKKESCHFFIGDKFVDTDFNDGWDYVEFVRRREKEIAFSFHYKNVRNFSAALDVFCELTPSGLAAWQNKVYEAIMEAYQLRLDEYEEKLAAFNSQRARANASSLYGPNPAYSKTCCNEELRKLSISLMSKNAQPDTNSYNGGEPPLMNVEAANANSAIIRFFESAFEWNNMAYVLYPYFWGRTVRWIDAIQLHGNENEFNTFLKAGAARVQLAVRPGFERAVAYYLQFGTLWGNTDSVVGDSENYLPIVEEIAENTGNVNEPQPYPANAQPWEISLPTTLVYLQREVPVMEDSLMQNQ